MQLPSGPEMKLLNEDPETKRRDFLLRVPAGYREPEHSHEGFHIVVILEGSVVEEATGRRLGPTDYFFGPSITAHGPFSFPDGAVLFVSFTGDAAHVY